MPPTDSAEDTPCPVCQDLSTVSDKVDPTALMQSAEAMSCTGCMLLFETLKQFDVDMSSLKYSTDIMSDDLNGPSILLSGEDHPVVMIGDDLEIEIYASPSQYNLSYFSRSLINPDHTPPPLSHLTPAPSVQTSTGKGTTMSQIKSWLQTCTETHKSGTGCPPNLSVPLPTRLLDVTNNTIRLIETSNATGTYACLSHCWGPTPLLRTLHSNYASHKSCIPMTSLPPTFRDAITVTRNLDIPYLWIDSLCIIQDDNDDWEREAAQMARIYQNGRVTITASRSDGSSGGCFADCSDHLPKSLVVNKNGETHHACARKKVEHGGWPVLSRGWIFQERLLSPRVLHFGHAEVVWECFEALQCQCSRVTVPGFQKLDFMMGRKRLSDQWTVSSEFAGDMTGRKLSKEWMVDMWRRLVGSYSRLDLTYLKDVLPALSGSARQLARLRGSRYFAGMWEDTLVEDLLWESAERWAPRTEEWIAPTWSWAVVSGGAFSEQYLRSGAEFTEFRSVSEMGQVYVTVDEVEVVPLGLDPMGRIKKAHLVLTGPTLVAEMKREFGEYSVGDLVLQGYQKDDEGEFDKDFDFRTDYCLSAEGRGFVPEGTLVTCLKMASASNEGGGKGQVFYLVLRWMDGPEPAFERIGIANYSVEKASRYKQLEAINTIRII